MTLAARQSRLPGVERTPPEGVRYRDDFISADEESALIDDLRRIAFHAVEMRGVVARRRTAHYGWTYEYNARTSAPGEPLPDFLLPLRARAAGWAGVGAEELAEALITEYPADAGIGWHRDAPMFGDVIAGVSLLGACRMKFRPYIPPRPPGADRPSSARRTTHEIALLPRSAYLITGVARREYEHSIPPATDARYSITFRTVVQKKSGP